MVPKDYIRNFLECLVSATPVFTQLILSPFGFVKDMKRAEDGSPVHTGVFYSCIYISSSTASTQITFWSLECFLRIVTCVWNLGWQCLYPRKELWDNRNKSLRLRYSILGWCLRLSCRYMRKHLTWFLPSVCRENSIIHLNTFKMLYFGFMWRTIKL